MALPFNLVAVFIFLTLQPPHFQQVPGPETEADLNTTLSWPDVGRGVIVSMGQVYAVNELEPSLLINLAVLLSSPLLFVMANIGAALGTLLSLAFIEKSEYDQVNQSSRCLLFLQGNHEVVKAVDDFSCTMVSGATTPCSVWRLSPVSSSPSLSHHS